MISVFIAAIVGLVIASFAIPCIIAKNTTLLKEYVVKKEGGKFVVYGKYSGRLYKVAPFYYRIHNDSYLHEFLSEKAAKEAIYKHIADNTLDDSKDSIVIQTKDIQSEIERQNHIRSLEMLNNLYAEEQAKSKAEGRREGDAGIYEGEKGKAATRRPRKINATA